MWHIQYHLNRWYDNGSNFNQICFNSYLYHKTFLLLPIIFTTTIWILQILPCHYSYYGNLTLRCWFYNKVEGFVTHETLITNWYFNHWFKHDLQNKWLHWVIVGIQTMIKQELKILSLLLESNVDEWHVEAAIMSMFNCIA
jgi:hypothetical protein